MTLARPLSRLYISRIQRLLRTSEFPETDLSNFLDNRVHPTLVTERRVFYPDPDEEFHPNAAGLLGAALAGGGNVFQGIGQAASSVGNMFWEGNQRDLDRQLRRDLLDTQWGNMFKYQQGQNKFGWDINSENWRNQGELTKFNWGQQKSLQYGLQQREYENQLALGLYTQEMAGYRTPGAQYGLNASITGGSGQLSLPSTTPGDPTGTGDIHLGGRPIPADEDQTRTTRISSGIQGSMAEVGFQGHENVSSPGTYSQSQWKPSNILDHNKVRVNRNIGGLRPGNKSTQASSNPSRNSAIPLGYGRSVGGVPAKGRNF